MENQNNNQELLPKPQTDLPLPEKELPAHATPQGHALQNQKPNIFKSRFFLGFAFIVLLLISGAAVLGGKYYLDQQKLKAINDFESCAAAGFPVAESYPATCRTTDGRSFTQVLSEEEQKNLNPNPTTDSKTYEGDGFSFKYPSSSIIKESENPKAFITSLKSKVITIKKDTHDPIDNNPAGDNFTLEISVAENPNNLTPKQIIENYKSELGKNTEKRADAPYLTGMKQTDDFVINKIDNSVKDYTLNNITGTYAKFGFDYNYEVILMSKNNKIYMFLYHNGEGESVINDAKKYVDQMLSTFKFTDSGSSADQSFLDIPEFGVKIPLSEAIKDAYYEMKTSNGVTSVKLLVHSLDSEPYCNDGIAFLSKISKDKLDERTKALIDTGNTSLVVNYYYYIEGEQAVCAQKTSNRTIEVNARKEFTEVSKNIIAI